MSLYSLKNQKQFDLVNARGKKITGAYFIIILAQGFDSIEIPSEIFPLSDLILFGMKVSKKLSKKAVVRNLIKRRVRHLMRLMSDDSELNFSKTALIFIPFKNFETIEFALLRSELRNVLKARISK